MAKRFIDTGFYKSPFVRGLKGALKGLYSFIICDCDGSGIWSKDLPIASAYIGFEITDQDFEIFVTSGKAIDLKNGKYFFPDFIEHQYPQGLQEKNPAHKNFIFQLRKYNLIDKNFIVIKGSKEGLQSPLGNGIGNSNGQDNGSGNTFGKSENLLLIPEMLEVFKKFNPKYLSQKEKDFKPLFSIAQFFCEQGKLTGSPDMHREKILEVWEPICKIISKDNFYSTKTLSTISNQIQSITQTAIHGKPTAKNGKQQDYGSKERGQQYDGMLNERYGSGGSATGKDPA